jgi:hypothetical protein
MSISMIITPIRHRRYRCPGCQSDFSNYQPDLLLSAPGTDIVSAYPGSRYVRWSGASTATP